MTDHDAFSQGFLQVLDRIALMQGPEGRRDRKRARAHLVDRVALRAIKAREPTPLLDVSRIRGRRAEKMRGNKRGADRCSGELINGFHDKIVAASSMPFLMQVNAGKLRS